VPLQGYTKDKDERGQTKMGMPFVSDKGSREFFFCHYMLNNTK
jgi:hypothetical protein